MGAPPPKAYTRHVLYALRKVMVAGEIRMGHKTHQAENVSHRAAVKCCVSIIGEVAPGAKKGTMQRTDLLDCDDRAGRLRGFLPPRSQGGSPEVPVLGFLGDSALVQVFQYQIN